MNGNVLPLLLALLAFSLGSFDALAQESGDVEWRHRKTQGDVTLTANPLGSASRSAFYAARGFSVAMIEPYAQACGFSFGVRNDGAQPIVVALADWRAVGADGRTVAVRLPEHWDAKWDKDGIPRAARIAFKWAQFQSENTFEPGDWIMGMATLESVPAAPFRLIARYRDNKGKHEIVLDKLACAD